MTPNTSLPSQKTTTAQKTTTTRAQVVEAIKRSAQKGHNWQWMNQLGQITVLERGQKLYA